MQLKGLPFKATEADIQDFFQGYAVVDMGVRILLQDDKRASGMVRLAAFIKRKCGALLRNCVV